MASVVGLDQSEDLARSAIPQPIVNDVLSEPSGFGQVLSKKDSSTPVPPTPSFWAAAETLVESATVVVKIDKKVFIPDPPDVDFD